MVKAFLLCHLIFHSFFCSYPMALKRQLVFDNLAKEIFVAYIYLGNSGVYAVFNNAFT